MLIQRLDVCRCEQHIDGPPRLPFESKERYVNFILHVLWAFDVGWVKVLCAQHFATPLGATASVISWERIGAAIAHLAHVFLKLPVLRYVDDFFSAERSEFASCYSFFHIDVWLQGVKQCSMAWNVLHGWCG